MEKPCWEFNFADFVDFFRFRGKKNREFGFRTLLVGSNRNGNHIVVFVTLFATKEVTKMEAI